MKKSNRLFVITTAMLFVCFTSVIVAEDPFEITIDVAPNVLNLESNATVVTVHTDIPYSTVDRFTLTLNDVEIYYSKSDSRGFFVAKFVMYDIKELFPDFVGYCTMCLKGETNSGGSFYGNQDILVVKNVSNGNK